MKLEEHTRLMDEHIFSKYRAGHAPDSGALMQGQMRYISLIAQSVDESEKRLRTLADRRGVTLILTDFGGGHHMMRQILGWADRFGMVEGFGGLRRYLVELAGAVSRMWDAVEDLRDAGVALPTLPDAPRNGWVEACEAALDSGKHHDFLPMLAGVLDALDDVILSAVNTSSSAVKEQTVHPIAPEDDAPPAEPAKRAPEELARKSFRRAMTEEAEALAPDTSNGGALQ